MFINDCRLSFQCLQVSQGVWRVSVLELWDSVAQGPASSDHQCCSETISFPCSLLPTFQPLPFGWSYIFKPFQPHMHFVVFLQCFLLSFHLHWFFLQHVFIYFDVFSFIFFLSFFNQFLLSFLLVWLLSFLTFINGSLSCQLVLLKHSLKEFLPSSF